jgi:hypothetical protein
LLANEALDVLGLKPGATPVERKEAYRDLVKVWHPDRFGSDLRLRQKAEEKLQQINDAYRVLESSTGAEPIEAEKTASPVRDSGTSTYRRSVTPRRRGRSRSYQRVRSLSWVYGFAVLLLFLTGYYVLKQMPVPVAGTRPEGAAKTPAVQKPAEAVGAAKDSGGLDHASVAQFQVRTFSETETAQLDSACSRLKESHEAAAYQTCLKAQVDLITNPAGLPDLSGLGGVDRESMESACAEAKRLHGADGWNRCLTVQVAELAAEPERPDLSALNVRDRDAIEKACRSAKEREGPAAYNRCRVRFLKALVESR